MTDRDSGPKHRDDRDRVAQRTMSDPNIILTDVANEGEVNRQDAKIAKK